MHKLLSRVLFVTFLSYTPLSWSQDNSADDFWQREMQGLANALSDPGVYSRARGIWFELAEHSGVMFPVLPAQTHNLGQAHPDGTILIDLSVAGNEHVEVTAFWMAHEYGHQIMHHPQLMVTYIGQWLAAVGGTKQEDEADRWAAEFLDSYNYKLEPVLKFLCSLPDSGAGGAHSPGPERAGNVAEAYGYSGFESCEQISSMPGYAGPYLIKLGISASFNGYFMSADLDIDGNAVDEVDNIAGAYTIELGELDEGEHRFRLSEISITDAYGYEYYSGAKCAGTFYVSEQRTFELLALTQPDGNIECAFR